MSEKKVNSNDFISDWGDMILTAAAMVVASCFALTMTARLAEERHSVDLMLSVGMIGINGFIFAMLMLTCKGIDEYWNKAYKGAYAAAIAAFITMLYYNARLDDVVDKLPQFAS